MPRKLASLALLCLLAIVVAAPAAKAASAGEIEAGVNATLDRFYRNIGGARELAQKAVGVLVFPSVVKAGFGIGGEYGEGEESDFGWCEVTGFDAAYPDFATGACPYAWACGAGGQPEFFVRGGNVLVVRLRQVWGN